MATTSMVGLVVFGSLLALFVLYAGKHRAPPARQKKPYQSFKKRLNE